MPKPKKKPYEYDAEFPNAGAEAVPPGATRQALDRDEAPSDADRSDGGDRHAVGEPGGGNLSSGLVDDPDNDPAFPREETESKDDFEAKTAGNLRVPSKRATAPRRSKGLRPGSDHRGDSTVGTDPDSGAE